MTILQERKQQGIELGMQQGVQQGMKQGELKRARETALELIKMWMDEGKIAIAIKLTKEEIEKIKREMLN